MVVLVILAIVVFGSNMYVNNYVMKNSKLLKPELKAKFDKTARNIDIGCSIIILIFLGIMFLNGKGIINLPIQLKYIFGTPILAFVLFASDLISKVVILNKYLKG